MVRSRALSRSIQCRLVVLMGSLFSLWLTVWMFAHSRCPQRPPPSYNLRSDLDSSSPANFTGQPDAVRNFQSTAHVFGTCWGSRERGEWGRDGRQKVALPSGEISPPTDGTAEGPSDGSWIRGNYYCDCDGDRDRDPDGLCLTRLRRVSSSSTLVVITHGALDWCWRRRVAEECRCCVGVDHRAKSPRPGHIRRAADLRSIRLWARRLRSVTSVRRVFSASTCLRYSLALAMESYSSFMITSCFAGVTRFLAGARFSEVRTRKPFSRSSYSCALFILFSSLPSSFSLSPLYYAFLHAHLQSFTCHPCLFCLRRSVVLYRLSY